MGILTETLQPLLTRGLESGPFPITSAKIIEFLGGEPSATGKQVSPEGALRLSAVWDCVDLVSRDVARTPCPLYKRNGRDREKAEDNPLYTMLRTSPNPFMTAYTFIQTLQGHKMLRGNAYANIERDDDGRPVNLWPLNPIMMDTPVVSQAGTLLYTYHVPGGEARALTQDEVLHIRGLSNDGIMGYSTITMMRELVSLGMAYQEFAARFFGNNASPGGYIAAQKRLTEDAAKRLKDSWEEAHRGLTNAHRVAVLEEGLEWHQIGMALEDAQFIESSKLNRLEIASIWHIPAHKINELDRATFCMPADVEVYTEAGPKSIRDVRPGEYVWSRGVRGVQPARVKAVMLSGYESVVTLKTTNRTVRLTANHKVLARIKKAHAHVAAGAIPAGMERIYWVTDWIEAGQLEIGDTILTLKELPQEGTDYAPTRRVSEGFMEFCGLLLGDGNVLDTGVTIARAKDALYMDHYRGVMRAEFHAFEEQERVTRFSSVSASREMRQLGFGGDARSKRVPEWVFRLNADLRLALLRGYLDADGHADKKGRIAFHSVNDTMLSQMRHLCVGLGLPVTNMRRADITTRLPNGKSYTGEGFTFTCSDPGANLRIWSHDARYQERLLAGKPFGKKDRNYAWSGGRAFDEPGFSLSGIRSIERGVIAEPVYDLSLEGTHAFIANGVVVHNTNITEQDLDYEGSALDGEFAMWEQQLNLSLLTRLERRRMYFEFLRNALVRASIDKRYEAYQKGILSGFMTINDVRAAENLNSIEGMDVPLLPTNMALGAENMPDLNKPAPPPTVPAKRSIRKTAEGWETDGV